MSTVRDTVASARATLDALHADGAAIDAIERVALLMVEALDNGGKVWLFGNGGSAADAQHFAAELVGRFGKERRALAAEALTANTSVVTAIANDYGFDAVFARQLEACTREGDVVIGITTSGRSRNVLEGLRTARALGARTVALTVEGAASLRDEVDVWIGVPVVETARVQECHIVIAHALCKRIEDELPRG